MKVIAIVLAAGKALRMGRNKMALQLGEDTVGNRTVSAALAAEVDHVIVCIGANDSAQWLQLINHSQVSTVTSIEAEKGQAYSLRAGISKVIDMDADAIVVLLGDQPFIQSSFIQQLIETAKENSEAIYVAASFEQKERPPILFRKAIFSDLMQLKGDEGARKFVRSRLVKGLKVYSSDEINFVDIDTKEDYAWACKHL
ncbi:nucleotidyltransferase family protein [Shouchella patagoniensis]|uniref:nucleotidyltransferase family protein n=1 Tax=Shouchella patagoniensis TaxID=228576 RepID=UPI0009952E10|nr:nucleotidyltransferase family protein [Shouchella patagoniensis]